MKQGMFYIIDNFENRGRFLCKGMTHYSCGSLKDSLNPVIDQTKWVWSIDDQVRVTMFKNIISYHGAWFLLLTCGHITGNSDLLKKKHILVKHFILYSQAYIRQTYIYWYWLREGQNWKFYCDMVWLYYDTFSENALFHKKSYTVLLVMVPTN